MGSRFLPLIRFFATFFAITSIGTLWVLSKIYEIDIGPRPWQFERTKNPMTDAIELSASTDVKLENREKIKVTAHCNFDGVLLEFIYLDNPVKPTVQYKGYASAMGFSTSVRYRVGESAESPYTISVSDYSNVALLTLFAAGDNSNAVGGGPALKDVLSARKLRVQLQLANGSAPIILIRITERDLDKFLAACLSSARR